MKKRPKYYAPPNNEIRKWHEKFDKGFCKKSKLWTEAEALFWSLVFKEEIERDLPPGCTWVQKAPGCP